MVTTKLVGREETSKPWTKLKSTTEVETAMVSLQPGHDSGRSWYALIPRED